MLTALMLKQSKPVVILNLVSSVLQLSYECFQMKARSFRKYSRTLMNYVDLIGHSCGLIWNIAYLIKYADIKSDLEQNSDDTASLISEIEKMTTRGMNSSPAFNMLIVTNGLVIFGRFTQVFYMIRQTRTLFKILEVSFQDSRPFILIYCYICLTFAISSMVPNLGEY